MDKLFKNKKLIIILTAIIVILIIGAIFMFKGYSYKKKND